MEISINTLHGIVLREVKDPAIQELDPELYSLASEFIGKLKREEYDNVEAQIKDAIVQMTGGLLSLLLRVRLGKVNSVKNIDQTSLLDEEKYILDAADEKKERGEMILNGILDGRTNLLHSIAQKHRGRMVVVRFIQNVDQFVGSDRQTYGPFSTENVATIPYENAQHLMTQKMLEKIRWDD